MNTAAIIDGILMLILLLFIIVKTRHFYKYIGSKRRTFVNWLYFDHNTVIRSRSSRSIANKQQQNSYSIRICIVIIVIICAVVLEFILLDQPLPGMKKPDEAPVAPTIKR